MLVLRFFILLLCIASITSCASIVFPSSDSSRTLGTVVDDELIESVIAGKLKELDLKSFDDSQISVVSYDGNVLLVGQVPSTSYASFVENVAKDTRKVKQVYNHLKVAGLTSNLVQISDSMLTLETKFRLAQSSLLLENSIKVVTENGRIYLMGVLSPEEAQEAAQIARSVVGAQSVVTLFSTP